MVDSRELSYSECEALLRAEVVGRVAMSTPTGPHIVPVNYSVVDGSVILRTTPYSILGSLGRDTMLAFEVDQLDHAKERGWSVVARGRAEPVQDRDELDRIRAVWEPRSWAGGTRELFLRLHWIELTGRQLGSDWQPLTDQPDHRVG